MKAFTLVEVLIVAIIVAVLAAVALPAYNLYIKNSKEKIALSYGGAIASAAAAYYSQSQEAPLFEDIKVKAPPGFLGEISGNEIVVSPAGSPAGYASGDFDPQSVIWKQN